MTFVLVNTLQLSSFSNAKLTVEAMRKMLRPYSCTKIRGSLNSLRFRFLATGIIQSSNVNAASGVSFLASFSSVDRS